VAYAPSVDPQIAVAVIIEHGESGSKAAAPIAREMIRTYLKKTGPGKQLKAEGSKLEAVKVVSDG
jgi:cell division protein FtsI/penicillin-binding protein 2